MNRYEEIGSSIYVKDTKTGKLVLRSTLKTAGSGSGRSRSQVKKYINGYRK